MSTDDHSSLSDSRQGRYQHLFDNTPVAIWDEDFSALASWMDELRGQGVVELRPHLDQHPDLLRHALSLIRVVDMNRAALAQNAAESRDQLRYELPALFTDSTYTAFLHELEAVWRKQSVVEFESTGQRRDGQRLDVIIRVEAATVGKMPDWSRVIVTGTDITDRKRAEEALSYSQRQLQHLFNASPLAAAVYCLQDGRIQDVNDRFLDAFEITREEVIGRTGWELGLWCSEAERNEFVACVRRDHSVRDFEARFRSRSGRQFDMILSAQVVDLFAGPMVIIQANDVTERKRAERDLRASEEALRASEERLRLVVSQAPAMVWALDRELRITLSEGTGLKHLGLQPAQLVGMYLKDFLQTDDPEHPLLLKHRQAIAGESLDYVLDWAGRHLECRLEPMRDAQNQIVGCLGVGLDVTDRVRDAAALTLFRTLIDHTSDSIEVIDPDTGQFLDVNQEACRSHGYTREEYLGLTVSDIDPHAAEESWQAKSEEIRRSGWVVAESQHRRKDGSLFPVEVNCTLVSLDRDYFLAIVRDITERKQAEEERRRLESQILRAQKLESLGVMAGGIAHDFNNLLTVVLGNLRLATSQLQGQPATAALIREAQNGAERAADLTRQMLAYTGKGAVVIQPLRLDFAIEEMIQLLHSMVSPQATIHLDLQPALVAADATQIRQVLMNLLTNASEALEGRDGEISIRTGVRDATAEELNTPYLSAELSDGLYAFVEVRDTGCGMTEETLGKIFDPFFTTKFTGRGLGLAAVLGIVRSHRGTIRVQSILGDGAVFLLLLPCANAENEDT